MATVIIPVTSTIVQTMLKQVGVGSMIQNVGNTSVWISEYQNVTTGLGIELSPGSSLTVSKDNQQIYAVLDNVANNGPTQLAITDTLNSVLLNPANANPNKPDVFLVNLLSGIGSHVYGPFDVTGYKGLLLTIGDNTQGSTWALDFYTSIAAGVNIAEFDWITAQANMYTRIFVPIVTPYVKLSNNIVGSNGITQLAALGTFQVNDISGPYQGNLAWN